MESNSIVGIIFAARKITQSTRVLKDRVAGCYLLFSRLELN
jgi:hypothetical protein